MEFSSARKQRALGWMVHAFTASGIVLGLFALLAIKNTEWLTAFWLMGAAIVVDSVDGVLARLVNVKKVVPEVNGELLDNIVDFLNYTIVPSFFLLVNPLVPTGFEIPCVMIIAIASAFQFTQVDAKTHDHFFKGFPSYWNITVFYLFFWQFNAWLNLVILVLLAVLCFVPIKYIYPSRLDFLSHHKMVRFSMLFATIIWGITTAGLIWVYPNTNHFLVIISISYLIFYMALSLYRTWVPLLVQESTY